MTRTKVLRCGALLLWPLLTMPTRVHASPWSIAAVQAEPVDSGLRRGAPAVDDAADASRREAAAAFADAEAAFDRGDYRLAAARFGRAHALSPHPWTLYNLALSRTRSGDPQGAWRAFDELASLAATAEDRREAEAERDALLPLLAIVRVRGPAGARACIDGVMVETGASGRLDRVLEAGPHRLGSARDDRRLELAPGSTTVLDARPVATPRPRARPWLIAATVFSGAALGGSTAAAVLADGRVARGVAGGAAVVGAAALATTIAALVIVHRRPAPVAGPGCV